MIICITPHDIKFPRNLLAPIEELSVSVVDMKYRNKID